MQGAGRGGAGKGAMATGEVEVFVHGPGAKPQVVAASRTAPWIIDEIHRLEIETPVPTGNLVRGLYIEDLASAW